MITSQTLSKCSYFWILALFTAVVVLCSCKSETKPSNPSTPAAKVENAVKESELATVKLSPEAEKRLGIETAVVENRKLPRMLKLGGEIIAVPGHDAVISAPFAGKIVAPRTLLRAGANVRKGQEVFRLLLLPAEKDIIGARDEVEVKRSLFELAQAKAKRTSQLLLEKAVSEKAVEEALSELVAAEAAYKAAVGRLKLLDNPSTDSNVEGLSTMVLTAPLDGVLQKIHVSSDQTVAASAPLFEVSSQNPVWVRVPVYVGELEAVDAQREARIQPLGEANAKEARSGEPIQGPPSSDPNAASSDLFFQLKNEDGRFRIGQKVEVTLSQKTDEEEGLIVPLSAILYDIDGGTWVYTKPEPQVYARRRVELQQVVGQEALVARGIEAGNEVVITGAAEIFGTEFGAGK